jgi:proteic killer suppression protein
MCYYCCVILSWKDKETERLWSGYPSRRFPPDIQRSARRKLLMIHAAVALSDLRIPPGNRLHSLTGDRAGQHSISINDQWRICFVWRDGNAYDVEIMDYHS